MENDEKKRRRYAGIIGLVTAVITIIALIFMVFGFFQKGLTDKYRNQAQKEREMVLELEESVDSLKLELEECHSEQDSL